MATQKRSTRGSTKKAVKAAPSARKRAGLKASSTPAPTARKRATTATASRTAARKGGVIKRAIKKGISELVKVGS